MIPHIKDLYVREYSFGTMIAWLKATAVFVGEAQADMAGKAAGRRFEPKRHTRWLVGRRLYACDEPYKYEQLLCVQSIGPKLYGST